MNSRARERPWLIDACRDALRPGENGAANDPADDDIARGDVIAAAVGAAFDAGQIQRDAHGRLGRGDVRTKSSRRDLVTDVDVTCERAIVETLRAVRPDWTIEAEEEVVDAESGGPRWFVDPLDGTVNFFHGLPIFCVSIGLYVGKKPIFAVVHAPLLGETFIAANGMGAYSITSGGNHSGDHSGDHSRDNSGDDTGRVSALRISETNELSEAVVGTGFPYRRGELEHSNLENFGRFFYDVRGLRRMGSAALDLAFVAAGRLDAFWELHLSPFDLAAGALLVREAGGTVTDGSGGDDWLRGGTIVAGPAQLAAEMLGRIEG